MSTTPENDTTPNPPSALCDSMEKTDLEKTRSDVSSVVVTNASHSAASTKVKKGRSSGKKRGNRGVFQGEYKEYLLQRAPEYLALTGRNERTPWLTGLVEDWFTKYPWHLGSEPEEFRVLNSPDASQSLTQDEIKELKERRKAARDSVVKLGQEVSFYCYYVDLLMVM